jgi:hypothetical protein
MPSWHSGTVAKYDPLFKFLCRAGDEPVTLEFDDVERLVGPLPTAALKSRRWWGNDPSAGTPNVQSKAWLNAGREVESVDHAARRVRFGPPGWRRGS